MDLEIYLIGLNHKTAGVDVREKAALSDAAGFEQGLLSCIPGAREAMVLSTCNRVEILLVADRDVLGLPDHVIGYWAGVKGVSPREIRPFVYIHQGDEAVAHLFSVASSLDSMIVGEPQILGQIKKAYKASVERGAARVIVNRIMHKSFSVAKRVRTETAVASSAVSISYAAVELAKRIFDDFSGVKAMLVGAGEMAELAATHLLACGVDSILVANRTFERAADLAQRFGGEPVLFETFVDRLAEVDIVISSTGSPHAIIRARDVKTVLKQRKNRPMFFIDIAVPRDIDPDINSLDNVYLYDIDDLTEVVEENLAQRKGEAQKARSIVAAEALEFRRWLKSLELQPTIVDMLQMGEDVARRELQRTLRRLGPDVDPDLAGALERMAISISQKILHEPIAFLKRRSREEGASRKFIDTARRMFDLDQDDVPEDAHADRRAPGSARPAHQSVEDGCLGDFSTRD